jgi:DNA polymerase-3 subunit delta'
MSGRGKPAKADLPPAWPHPRANSDLLGHQKARENFMAALEAGRMHHAWLLTGPRGIGKATLAYRLASDLLTAGERAAAPVEDEGGGLFGMAAPAAPPPLRSPALVANGAHPDMFVLERRPSPTTGRLRGEIVVEDVRAMSSFLAHTPAIGKWRVVVVDCADDLNRNAANALLKRLEEPPRHALILLVCHAPGGLLPTIRSRCRRLEIDPLAEADIDTLLTRYLPDHEPADRATLARLARGSVGEALRLADAGGLDLYRTLITLIGSLPELDIPALHGFADKLAQRGGEEAFRTATGLLRDWQRRAIRTHAAGAAAAGDRPVVPGEDEIARRLMNRASLDQWLELWDNLGRLIAQAESINLDRKQVVLDAFIGMARLARG